MMTHENTPNDDVTINYGSGACTKSGCSCTAYVAPGTSRGGCKTCTHRQSWHK